MLNTPVLFLIFNRPDLTERVFASIREAKPTQLFIAADGPRESRDGEADICEQTRDIVLKHIDWDCDVKTLLRDKNLGCKMAVSSAISWFFDNVEDGIILEDDTLPDVSFFSYCSELLDRYRNDTRVSFISGTCISDAGANLSDSYYFSKFSIIWGWASWKRVWKNYDIEIADWKKLSGTNWLTNVFYGNTYYAGAFKKMFDAIYSGYDTWDFQFFFLNLKSNSLNICPSKNMVKNIGFDERATHTHSPKSYSDQAVFKMDKLNHPLAMAFDYEADKIIFDVLYKYDDRPQSLFRTFIEKIKYRLRKLKNV